MAPQIWSFTVRDAQVARQLNSMLGERVRLHYTEHKGVPSSCFGDTPYYVDERRTGCNPGRPLRLARRPRHGACATASARSGAQN